MAPEQGKSGRGGTGNAPAPYREAPADIRYRSVWTDLLEGLSDLGMEIFYIWAGIVAVSLALTLVGAVGVIFYACLWALGWTGIGALGVLAVLCRKPLEELGREWLQPERYPPTVKNTEKNR